MRLLDNEHGATRPQDQIQLARRKLFEFQRFPVHYVPQRIFLCSTRLAHCTALVCPLDMQACFDGYTLRPRYGCFPCAIALTLDFDDS